MAPGSSLTGRAASRGPFSARRERSLRGDGPIAFVEARSYVCLGCGAPMVEIACKMRCRACGYFEDCGNGLTPPPVDLAR